jgi:hypothetical protein
MVLLLLVCLATLDAALPSVGTVPCAKMPTTARLLKLIEGRLMLCRVNKGMTEAEVLKILGEPNIYWSSA